MKLCNRKFVPVSGYGNSLSIQIWIWMASRAVVYYSIHLNWALTVLLARLVQTFFGNLWIFIENFVYKILRAYCLFGIEILWHLQIFHVHVKIEWLKTRSHGTCYTKRWKNHIFWFDSHLIQFKSTVLYFLSKNPHLNHNSSRKKLSSRSFKKITDFIFVYSRHSRYFQIWHFTAAKIHIWHLSLFVLFYLASYSNVWLFLTLCVWLSYSKRIICTLQTKKRFRNVFLFKINQVKIRKNEINCVN